MKQYTPEHRIEFCCGCRKTTNFKLAERKQNDVPHWICTTVGCERKIYCVGITRIEGE